MLRQCLIALLLGSAHGLAPFHPHPDPALLSVVQHSGMAFVGKVTSAYTDALAQHPLATKMATGGILATAGDAIAQTKSAESYDKRRAASFAVFDMAYRATQHLAFPFLVHEFHGQYLGKLMAAAHIASQQILTEYAAAMEQTLASQLGIVPFLYYPVFFSLTAAVQGLPANAALERAKENFVPLMKRNLLFWIPVQFIQFGFIDEQLQIPFLSAAGLCWTFILSMAAGSASSYNKRTPTIQQVPEEPEEVEEVFVVGEKALSGASTTN